MKVLVTGADGFIGRNLLVHLNERKDIEVLRFTRDEGLGELRELVVQADFVFHLAGVNRPTDPSEFTTGNRDLTIALCDAIRVAGRHVPVLYTSSVQAVQDNAYGHSKRQAEDALVSLSRDTGIPVLLFRLPNVFGKWARPNYNSAVATFCHNIARNLPVEIHDPEAIIRLVYVDDVVAHFLALLTGVPTGVSYPVISPEYSISVGDLAQMLKSFRDSRDTLTIPAVGTGLTRALYSTYVSYLPTNDFVYDVPAYGDARGTFVEMLKTGDSGQFSYFTAHPGVTRGGHYHHSKTEKFLVIKGKARFGFRHIVSGQTHHVYTDGAKPQIVETVPGWTHDIANIGDEEMVVMLWANEIFNRDAPDTYACPVEPEATDKVGH